MTAPLNVEDNNLYMSEETWNDLQTRNSSSAYSNVKALATFTVERGGAFIIHRAKEDDTSVLSSFHRPSELKEFFDKVDQQRANFGL